MRIAVDNKAGMIPENTAGSTSGSSVAGANPKEHRFSRKDAEYAKKKH
jgi:hypothetical protein